MANIPAYDQWMKDTQVRLRKRSPKLKLLDEAMAATPQDPSTIKKALDDWKFDQSSQGKNWRESSRNSNGAVTRLYDAVNLDKRNLSGAEREALKYIARAQSMALIRQFDAKTVEFKSTTVIGMATNGRPLKEKLMANLRDGGFVDTFKDGKGTITDTIDNVKGVKAGINTVKTIGGVSGVRADNAMEMQNKIMSLIKATCGNADPDQVFKIGGFGMSPAKFATDIAPFIGAVSAGGKCISAWVGVAKKAHQQHAFEQIRSSFAPQDPAAAFDAIQVLLKREIAARTAEAGVATGAFTGKLLGTFLDAGAVSGPTIGILETLASILQTIVEIGVDMNDRKKANEMLKVGALNLDLFKSCPLLGCYFLTIQDHSTIINYAVGDYGNSNFVFDAERLIQKIDPVLEQSREYIHASRLCIPNMTNSKGIVNEGFSVKSGTGKLAAIPGEIQDRVWNKIEDWTGNPERPPKVDPTRIKGYGHLGGGGFGPGA